MVPRPSIISGSEPALDSYAVAPTGLAPAYWMVASGTERPAVGITVRVRCHRPALRGTDIMRAP
jgi:hypothetical protein